MPRMCGEFKKPSEEILTRTGDLTGAWKKRFHEKEKGCDFILCGRARRNEVDFGKEVLHPTTTLIEMIRR